MNMKGSAFWFPLCFKTETIGSPSLKRLQKLYEIIQATAVAVLFDPSFKVSLQLLDGLPLTFVQTL